tara:strand:- start:769 stop:1518 length:750 start_codon:yes stop_codon:yes gene_type:complete
MLVAQHGESHSGPVVIYTRVSTNKQGIHGLGIKAQKEMINKALNGGDWEIIAEFQEQESGTKTDEGRPELAKAIKLCRQHNATLWVSTMSRLSRRASFVIRLIEEMEEGKFNFFVADNPTMHTGTLEFQAVMAAQQARQIRRDTKAALGRIKEHIAKEGSYTAKSGRVITKLGVHHNQDKAQKAAVQANKDNANVFAAKIITIIDGIQKEDPEISLRGIARKLNQLEIKTARGGDWHPTTVAHILKRVG